MNCHWTTLSISHAVIPHTMRKRALRIEKAASQSGAPPPPPLPIELPPLPPDEAPPLPSTSTGGWNNQVQASSSFTEGEGASQTLPPPPPAGGFGIAFGMMKSNMGRGQALSSGRGGLMGRGGRTGGRGAVGGAVGAFGMSDSEED